MSREQVQGLRSVILRSLNKNQLLILSEVDGFSSATKLLSLISEGSNVPLSTLKLNAKVLKELQLIEFNNSPVRITPTGRFVLEVIKGDKNG